MSVKLRLKFYGKVEKGRPVMDDDGAMRRFIGSFEGKRIEIDIAEYKSKRSNEQNRAYWGLLIPVFADYFGLSNEETHECLKAHHLRRRKVLKDGKEIWIILSTAGLTTSEFCDYYELLQRWGAEEFGLNVPSPNEPPDIVKRFDAAL